MRFLIALPLFLLLVVVVLFSPLPLITKKVIIAGGLYTIGYALSSDWLLRGMEQIRYVALGNSVLSCTFLLCVLFFVRQPQDAFIAAFLRSISFFFASGALLLVLKRKFNMTFKPRLSLTQWKVHLKESWYFALTTTVSSVIAPLMIILIAVMYNPESVGFFTAPYRIIVLILGFMGIFTLSFYPVLADQFAHNHEFFPRTCAIYRKIMLIVGIPIGVGGFVLSKSIIHLLLGKGYGPSVEVFNILIWLIPLNFIKTTYSSTLLATGFQRLYLIAIGVSCVIAAALCSFLIPSWGIKGATVILLFQQGISLIIVITMFKQYLHRFTFFDCYFIKVLVASIIMGTIIWGVKINVFGQIFVGMISYSLLALLLKLVTKEQLVSFYALLQNMMGREFVSGNHSNL